jgi:hypothetical protein
VEGAKENPGIPFRPGVSGGISTNLSSPGASISVHHPPLNLTVEEGRNSHDRAEEILTFLAESGYKHAGPISN